MELTEPLDIYAYQLGAVWGRLSSLETLLRVAISGGNFRAPFGVEVGDEIEPDALNRGGYMSGLSRPGGCPTSRCSGSGLALLAPPAERGVRLIAAKITDGSATGPWASSLVEPLSRKPLGGQQPELVGMYSVTPYFYSAHWLG